MNLTGRRILMINLKKLRSRESILKGRRTFTMNLWERRRKKNYKARNP